MRLWISNQCSWDGVLHSKIPAFETSIIATRVHNAERLATNDVRRLAENWRSAHRLSTLADVSLSLPSYWLISERAAERDISRIIWEVYKPRRQSQRRDSFLCLRTWSIWSSFCSTNSSNMLQMWTMLNGCQPKWSKRQSVSDLLSWTSGAPGRRLSRLWSSVRGWQGRWILRGGRNELVVFKLITCIRIQDPGRDPGIYVPRIKPAGDVVEGRFYRKLDGHPFRILLIYWSP